MSRILLLQSQERLTIWKAMTDTAGLHVAGLVVLVRLHSSTRMLLNARVVTERRRMMGEFSCCDSCRCRWFRTLITLSHTRVKARCYLGRTVMSQETSTQQLKRPAFLLSNAKCQIHSKFLYLITLHKCVEKKFVKDKRNTSIDPWEYV